MDLINSLQKNHRIIIPCYNSLISSTYDFDSILVALQDMVCGEGIHK